MSDQHDLDATLAVLRAVAEPSRLRLVAILAEGELSVSELTEVVGQSQPRVSRHVRLLADAGVVRKQREGSWTFVSLDDRPEVRHLVWPAIHRLDRHDPILAADRARLDEVRRRRRALADAHFASVASVWDTERSLHAAPDQVEDALRRAVAGLARGHVVDLGTGTGRMLEVLAGPDTERLVGLDASPEMLAVARVNLADLGAELRQADLYHPPADLGRFDLAVVHQVLHYLDDPERALREAARLLRPGGHLVVIDVAAHEHEFLRTDHGHRRLGFGDDAVRRWLIGAGLRPLGTVSLDPPPDRPDGLVVLLWTAHAPSRTGSDELEQDVLA